MNSGKWGTGITSICTDICPCDRFPLLNCTHTNVNVAYKTTLCRPSELKIAIKSIEKISGAALPPSGNDRVIVLTVRPCFSHLKHNLEKWSARFTSRLHSKFSLMHFHLSVSFSWHHPFKKKWPPVAGPKGNRNGGHTNSRCKNKNKKWILPPPPLVKLC